MVPTTDQIKNKLIPRLKEIIQNSGGGSSTDTSTSISFKVAVGDNQPVGAHLWYNTSDYVSVQGETPTRIITIDDTKNPVVRGNTRPSKTGVFWWNTSNYGGGSD